MTEKLPTIDIKGKQYVLVKDRILAFNELYKGGCIKTELRTPPESKLIVFKAVVTPDIKEPERCFVGHSQAIVGSSGVNATSAMENAETSAVGRALAMMGIGILESVASADEIKKSTYTTAQPKNVQSASKLVPCNLCGADYKLIAAGVSKAGKPYNAFYACSTRGCKAKTFQQDEANMMMKQEHRVAESMGGEVINDGAPPIDSTSLPF